MLYLVTPFIQQTLKVLGIWDTWQTVDIASVFLLGRVGVGKWTLFSFVFLSGFEKKLKLTSAKATCCSWRKPTEAPR